ncbi:carboxymuconolactone decarboxylase family protein [Streptomyces sp. NPDC001617]
MRHHRWIGGKPEVPVSGAYLRMRDPAPRLPGDDVAAGSAPDVSRAVAAAAAPQPAWARRPAAERTEVRSGDVARGLRPAERIDAGQVAFNGGALTIEIPWGVRAREGVLGPRGRSLLVLAMTAALGRMEEFRIHAGTATRTGVTDTEVDELLFQIAAYCGVPAGSAARRAVKDARAEREAGS